MPSFTHPQTQMATHGHTHRDAEHLHAAGIDPSTTQPRDDHAIRCTHTGCRNMTWHQAAGCDAHYTIPAAARRTLTGVQS